MIKLQKNKPNFEIKPNALIINNCINAHENELQIFLAHLQNFPDYMLDDAEMLCQKKLRNQFIIQLDCFTCFWSFDICVCVCVYSCTAAGCKIRLHAPKKANKLNQTDNKNTKTQTIYVWRHIECLTNTVRLYDVSILKNIAPWVLWCLSLSIRIQCERKRYENEQSHTRRWQMFVCWKWSIFQIEMKSL